MGTHLTVLRESFPINNNITGFRWFSKKSESMKVMYFSEEMCHCALDESSLSIERVTKKLTSFL